MYLPQQMYCLYILSGVSVGRVMEGHLWMATLLPSVQAIVYTGLYIVCVCVMAADAILCVCVCMCSKQARIAVLGLALAGASYVCVSI